MERYRTRLICGAPEFDTYGVLKDFARHPTSLNHSRLNLLLNRVDTQYTWDCVVNARVPDAYEDFKRLRSGAWLYSSTPKAKEESLNANSSIDEYKKACALAGFDIKQEDLDKLGINTNE